MPEAPELPTAVWGRDELKTGYMWNSNSVVSWLITRSGIARPDDGGLKGIQPPVKGRAPGWAAGIIVAARAEQEQTASRVTQATAMIQSSTAHG